MTFDPNEIEFEDIEWVYEHEERREERIKAIKWAVRKGRWFTGAGLVDLLNNAGKTDGLPKGRDWKITDIYQAVRETRKFGELTSALVSNPSLGYRFYDNIDAPELQNSVTWGLAMIKSHLSSIKTGQLDPTIPARERERVGRDLVRIIEDIDYALGFSENGTVN